MTRKRTSPAFRRRSKRSQRLGATPGARVDWAETLTQLLDEAIPVPGTNLRIGLDSILGFFLPGAGDALGGVFSLALLGIAVQHRLPAVVVVRIALNIAFDALVGTIPIVGDIFDVGFKANRRNLELIRRYRAHPSRRLRLGDYVVVFGALTVVLAAIALPVALFVWSLSALLG